MIKIFRESKTDIYMHFDSDGNDELISAFTKILKGQPCKLDVIFDLSIIKIKKKTTKLINATIILKIDNSVDYSLFIKSEEDEKIIWVMDEDDADYGLEAFTDCKKSGSFFPSEFIRFKMPKNKNIDDMYCQLYDVI